MRHLLYSLCLIGLAGAAQAFEPDLNALERTGYLKRLEQFGTWETTRSQEALIMACTNCSNPVTVFFIVRDHRASHPQGGLAQSYLEERKAYCQRLASARTGRCVGISKTNIRWLAGYRAQAVEKENHLSEQVLFYGGYALTASVREEGGFEFGDQMADSLAFALVRMTPAW